MTSIRDNNDRHVATNGHVATNESVATKEVLIRFRCGHKVMNDLEVLSCIYSCSKSDVLRKLVEREVERVGMLVDYGVCMW